MQKFTCNIVTPEKTIFGEELTMVTVPGIEGEFSVMIGHVPMLTIVKPGIITIYNNEVVTKQIFVTKGFAEINNDYCNILVEEAIDIKDFNKHDMQARIANLNSKIMQNQSENYNVQLQEELLALNNIAQKL